MGLLKCRNVNTFMINVVVEDKEQSKNIHIVRHVLYQILMKNPCSWHVCMTASVSDAPLSSNENETTLLYVAKEYGEEVKGKDAQASKGKKPKKKTKEHRLVDSMIVPLNPRFQTPLPGQHQVLQNPTVSGLPATGNLQTLHPQHPGSLPNRAKNQLATSSSMLQYPGQHASTKLRLNSLLVASIQPSIPSQQVPNNRLYHADLLFIYGVS
ncbi:hypothetical protein Tco_1501710 [Tanacetum coccineum]